MPPLPATAQSFMSAILKVLSIENGVISVESRMRLNHQLETLVSDSNLLRFRKCEIALALLQNERIVIFEAIKKNETEFFNRMIQYFKVDNERYKKCLEVVTLILHRYNKEGQVPYRQRLTWKLSNRTLSQLRPTRGMKLNLPKIIEEPNLRRSCGSDDEWGETRKRVRSSSECCVELHELSGSESEDAEENLDVVKVSRTWADVVAGH